MAAPGSVVINFFAKTANAVRDVDKLTRSVKKAGDESGKSDSKMGKLGGTMKAGLAAGAIAAGAGLFALGGFLVEAGKAALEDKKSSDNLANTLKKIPGVTDAAVASTEDWISAMTLATNVADTDLRQALGKLALATGNVKKAQELLTVAVDVSAGSGKSLKSVTEAMAKAQDGNTASLKRMFPWLDKNKDGAVSLKEATDGLGKAYEGAAAKAADNDPWLRLQTIWGELKESLGRWLIPLVEKFGEWFKKRDNQRAIQDFIDDMGDLASELGNKLVPALEDFLGWLKSDSGKKAMRDFGNAMSRAADAAQYLSTGVRNAERYLRLLFGLAAPWWLRGVMALKGGGGGSVSGGGEFSATPTTATHATPTTTSTVVVNWYGGSISDNEARRIKRLLEADDVRQGRARGTPLAVAW